MKHALYIVFVFATLGNCFGQTLVANPQDSQYEGGELRLMNSNANYNQWNIDNYQGKLRFHHSGSVQFLMNPDGDLGIGTTGPTSRLDVRSSNGNRIRLNYNDTPSISFIPNNGNSHFHISHALNNRLTISQGSQVGVNHLFTVVNSGAIGIGTTTPDAKLAVKGKIHAEEVKVDLSVPGPDYVFKEGYDLKSIDEIREYIREYGHLPNIPSAREMEKNGVQLGEMNMKLLEKIEELTLYTIQQEKRLQEINEKYEKQNQEINELKMSIQKMRK